jgi:hypothetical protein
VLRVPAHRRRVKVEHVIQVSLALLCWQGKHSIVMSIVSNIQDLRASAANTVAAESTLMAALVHLI